MANIIFFNAQIVDSTINSKGVLLVQEDKILAVVQGDFSREEDANKFKSFFDTEDDIQLFDCQNKTLMPSFIDMHVHFRYPGQTQKEDLQSGLSAAVAGGFGTVVLMPNTNPVVSSSDTAHQIEDEAASYKMADVIQTVSITKDFSGTDTSHIDNLEGISVITEDGHDVNSSLVMLDAMSKCTVKGIIVDCHCEDESFTASAKEYRKRALQNKDTSELGLIQAEADLQEANRLLALAEDIATERNISLAKNAGCQIHVAHVSTANSIYAIKEAKAEADFIGGGFSITCEVTPHHFALNAETGENIKLIVNPPLRSEIDRQALLQAFTDGTVDVISTDHAPHTLEDKQNGAPGFSGLETSFAVANTELVETGVISINRLSELMSANPAKILGLDNKYSFDGARGKLEEGFLANLVLVDLTEEWTVDSSKFKTKGKICPFENMEVIGKVSATWFKGEKVF